MTLRLQRVVVSFYRPSATEPQTVRSATLVSFFWRLLSALLVAAAMILVLELASPSIYEWLHQKPFDRATLLDSLQRVASGNVAWEDDALQRSKKSDIEQRFNLHPFVGFTRKGWMPESLVHTPEFGNRDGAKDRSVRIGIFGASVAGQLGRVKHLLARRLNETCYPNKQVVVDMFSMGGFKQPQQLILLTYLLSLGLHLDVLINVDGLNEVGYMAKRQALEGEYPFHPQLWNSLLWNNLGLPEIRAIARMAEFRESQREWAQVFVETSVLSRSAYALALWDTVHQRTEQRFLADHATLSVMSSNRARDGVAEKRITEPYTSDEAMLADFAAVWKRSSMLMHQISTANGIAYYHYLQPNQHVNDSKPFTEEEIEIAKVDAGTPLEGLVRLGYPLLRKAGLELQTAGVVFEDLTGIYAQETATIYIDHCCHMNRYGSELLGGEIARRIGSSCHNQ